MDKVTGILKKRKKNMGACDVAGEHNSPRPAILAGPPSLRHSRKEGKAVIPDHGAIHNVCTIIENSAVFPLYFRQKREGVRG